jgi:N-acetylmuramate 1-kinase
MSTQKPPVSERVSSWVGHWLSSKNEKIGASIAPLAGDGSTRQFFRVKGRAGGGEKTWVLLSDDGWISSKDYAPHQLYLRRIGIPVPEFHEVDPAQGFLVMEDLGDELLQERMRRSEDALRWLDAATRLVAQLHGKAYPVPADLPVSTRRFDAQKFFDELCFTGEHLVVGLLKGTPWTDLQKKEIRHFCEEIAGIDPQVFCHRDYHTRNLLVHGNRLFMIDFQDARLGPPHYDLASLLFDAYVPITDDNRRTLIAAYRDEVRRFPLGKIIDWANFDRDLARIAVQRTIKAAGSFASFFTRYGKRTHLPYLLPCLHTALALQTACFAADDPLLGALDITGWIQSAKTLNLASDDGTSGGSAKIGR